MYRVPKMQEFAARHFVSKKFVYGLWGSDIKVTMDQPVIFTLGIMPRSGTAYLWDLLSLHPDVVRHVPPYARARIPEDYLLEGIPHLHEYIKTVSGRWSPNWGDIEYEKAALLQCIGSGLQTFLRAECPPEKRVITRTPSVEHLEDFPYLFGQAPLIIIVRDGHSLVASYLRSFSDDLAWASRTWNRAAKIIADFDKEHAGPNQRHLIVRYEDLFQDPITHMQAILKCADLDSSNYPFEKIAQLPVRGSCETKAATGKVHWQPVERTPDFNPLARHADWDAQRLADFEKIAGPGLRLLGYPVGSAV